MANETAADTGRDSIPRNLTIEVTADDVDQAGTYQRNVDKSALTHALRRALSPPLDNPDIRLDWGTDFSETDVYAEIRLEGGPELTTFFVTDALSDLKSWTWGYPFPTKQYQAYRLD
jgi:hypothetical protein